MPIKLIEEAKSSYWELIMALKDLVLHVQIDLYRSQSNTVKDASAQKFAVTSWGCFSLQCIV